MQFNKLLVLAATMSAASMQVSAESTTYDVGFTTVPEITIIEVQALDFGTGMLTGTGGSCELLAAGSGTALEFAGDSVLKMRSGSTAQGADYNTFTSGGACDNSTGQATGLYRITGVPGGTVTVSPEQVVGTDFQYDPAGCVVDYNAGVANDDTCEDISVSTDATVVLANTDDTLVGAGGLPTSGQALINLGGTITQISTFVAGMTYDEQFTINVTY